MAVYHLACRLIADPETSNPPARQAKWQQACARRECPEMIWKGDMISCTRDNENGHRKGTEPRPVATPESVHVRIVPAPVAAPSEAEWVPRASLECARRLLEQERAHALRLASEVLDLQNVLHAIRAAIDGAK